MRNIVFIVLMVGGTSLAFSDDWTGAWHRNSLNDSAEIVITAAGSGKFHFAITAFSGAHTGEIEGDALIKGDSAEWMTNEDDVERRVGFERTTKGITVTTVECEGYFGGAGVVFDGEYVSEVVPEEKLAEERMMKLIPDAGLVKKIKALLGPSFVYVVSCLQLDASAHNLDDFHAKAIRGCVRGICPEMAAIVMYTPGQTLYVAWFQEGVVYYASSDLRYKKKLTVTIADWAEQYRDAQIVFK